VSYVTSNSTAVPVVVSGVADLHKYRIDLDQDPESATDTDLDVFLNADPNSMLRKLTVCKNV